MKTLRFAVLSLSTVGAILSAQAPGAQTPPRPTEIGQTKFASSRNVVPVYEGWIRNPDGSFDMVFGYFNRNFEEEVAVPIGADNTVEPGGPDRGQPTYFLPRRQARLFRVRVPKDWGTKELIWTLRVNGQAEKAYGELIPVEEINERIMMSGGNTVLDDDPNQPPAITLSVPGTASVSAPLTLTANVTDDGLPKPREPAPRPATPSPATTASADGTIQRQRNSNAVAARPRGLTVSWFQYGGPAKVIFSPAGAIAAASGMAIATAKFTAPGTYVLQATANDGALSKRTLVTVVVR
jgi:hypothetical protein